MSVLKGISLTREPQYEAYQDARTAVENELGGDPTDGELFQELAEAYVGFRYGGGDA